MDKQRVSDDQAQDILAEYDKTDNELPRYWATPIVGDLCVDLLAARADRDAANARVAKLRLIAEMAAEDDCETALGASRDDTARIECSDVGGDDRSTWCLSCQARIALVETRP